MEMTKPLEADPDVLGIGLRGQRAGVGGAGSEIDGRPGLFGATQANWEHGTTLLPMYLIMECPVWFLPRASSVVC